METEKRLIDANRALEIVRDQGHEHPNAYHLTNYATLILREAPTVDAVEANKYEELVAMYHELRENFVDYVCSGIRNEAPYCLNKCEDCVDKRGWCKLEVCKGFDPAEVILYRCAKMDGGNEDV